MSLATVADFDVGSVRVNYQLFSTILLITAPMIAIIIISEVLLIDLIVVFSLHIDYTDKLSVKPDGICSKNDYLVFLCFIGT